MKQIGVTQFIALVRKHDKGGNCWVVRHERACVGGNMGWRSTYSVDGRDIAAVEVSNAHDCTRGWDLTAK